MRTLEYTLRFATPAFLGNAEQSAQWRTPPIKALLRQWWRVAYAADPDHAFQPSVANMRRGEGRLFGVASDGEGDSRKSLVRMRLDKWDEGKLTRDQWPHFAQVSHPEVPKPVASDLYLAYGPVTLPRGAPPTLKANAAIQAGESATLSIAVPTTHRDADLRQLLEANVPRLERALDLMNRFGTLGGRSRNGWGSFALIPLSQTKEGWGEGALPLRPWRDCLQLDWPHAIGKDDDRGALIWQTSPHDDWKGLMKTLAELKIGLRRLFLFPQEKPDGEVHDRHWLSYPVTRHNVRAWDRGKLRLPNSLRFKVRETSGGRFVGVIFHVPCRPPAEFTPNVLGIERVWTQVHRYLDTSAQQLTRIGK